MGTDDDLVHVDLTSDEVVLLAGALVDWGGPAHPTEALARALGFAGLRDLGTEGNRIAQDIRHGRPLTPLDWTRALLSAEICFGSDLLGTGSEWDCIHGGNDEDWLRTLRGLARKLPASRAHLLGERPEPESEEPVEGPAMLGGQWVVRGRDGRTRSRFADDPGDG